MSPNAAETTQPVRAGHQAHTNLVIDLGDPLARVRERTGGKSAALAMAVAAGLPVQPGFVVTVDGVAALDAGGHEALEEPLRDAWKRVIGDGPAIARSSSVVEDGDEESMAGRYESVPDVASPDELLDALRIVADSRRAVAEEHDGLAVDHPIAVLVQRMVEPDWGGVAFGVDPVSGRPDRRAVAVGEGAPEDIVSGAVDGDTWTLTPDGTVVVAPEEPDVHIDADVLTRVVGLVEEVGRRFEGPQDVEWAADADGGLWLLQTRPVTTAVTGVPEGPELGTGPIAETFPDGLSALEEDLWVPPLREAISHAITIAAVAGPRDIEGSPVLVTIDGRPAVDLELFGRAEADRSPLRDRIRRIRASWRLGRLRAALPATGRRLAERVDTDLAAVESLSEVSDLHLLAMLRRSHDVLRSLHGHEILTGLITDAGEDGLTGSGVALRLLADARRRGLSDREAIAEEPAILALAPPGIGRDLVLPKVTDVPTRPERSGRSDDPGVVREALRMRVRWVHELTARIAEEIGRRLVARDVLTNGGDVALIRLQDLERAVIEGRTPPLHEPPSRDPLPARFRLTASGDIVPTTRGDGTDGTGAGGGQASGPVHIVDSASDLEDVPPDAVLVVGQLGPELAGALGGIAGLVAETGSPLSHVAILAREAGVATVVGLQGARSQLRDVDHVRVDGGSGDVEVKS